MKYSHDIAMYLAVYEALLYYHPVWVTKAHLCKTILEADPDESLDAKVVNVFVENFLQEMGHCVVRYKQYDCDVVRALTATEIASEEPVVPQGGDTNTAGHFFMKGEWRR